MYIRTGDFQGFLGGAKEAVELGKVVLDIAKDFFPGDNFQTNSGTISYYREDTPLERPFLPCRKRFWIEADEDPGAGSGMSRMFELTLPADEAARQRRQRFPPEEFWFNLSYEYNGNGLKIVSITPDLDKSTNLYKDKFTITFDPHIYSVPREPVAEVIFIIKGEWTDWHLLPGQNTVDRFSGKLYVRADGSARVEEFESKKDRVRFGGWSFFGCPPLLPSKPQPPKPPVRKYYTLPPILFPLNKHDVSEADAKRMDAWVKSWPTTTRDKVTRGEIMVTIVGFASRPGGGLYNLALSGRRAESVKRILRSFTGSNTKFDVKASGAYSPNLPSLADSAQWLKRFLDPNKYDQAAVVRFEDVE